MTSRATQALEVIRQSVADGRYLLLPHFTQRMDERGLFWTDILAILETPVGIRSGGKDRWHRPKWLIRGNATDGLRLEIVCVTDFDETGKMTVFITLY